LPFFFKKRGHKGKTGSVCGLEALERREDIKDIGGEYGGNVMYSCIKIGK
jgi:hypothetical protein